MIKMLQLEITGECQLGCGHCYADSGPGRGHGQMTTDDWRSVIDQATDLSIPQIQFIGGEPTLHPSFGALLTHALHRGRQVEVYTNLVHVTAPAWRLLRQDGVSIATSFYSDDPGQHQHITGRPSHARTLANITKALSLGIPLRAGIVRVLDDQRIAEAKALLAGIGVEHVGVDRMRMLGRPTGTVLGGQISELCGNCGRTVAGILPTGTIAGCPMSRFLAFGDVRTDGLAALLDRLAPPVPAPITDCGPHNDGQCNPCEPSCAPGCDPGVCSPHSGGGEDDRTVGVPAMLGHGCNPDNDSDDCSPAETTWDPDE